MTRKIYQYLMKEMFPTSGYAYLGMLAITIISSCIAFFRIPILDMITTSFTIIVLIGIPFVLFALVVITDYQNNQGKKAYLLRSIPASTSKLLGARILYYLTYYFITIILMLLLLNVFFSVQASVAMGIPIHITFTYFLDLLIEKNLLDTFIYIMVYLGISNMTTMLFSITIGSEARFKRFGIGGPFLIYFIQYFINQILTLSSMLFIPLSIKIPIQETLVTNSDFKLEFVNKSMFSALVETKGDFAKVPILGVGFLFVYIVMIIIMLIWTYRSMKNKLILN